MCGPERHQLRQTAQQGVGCALDFALSMPVQITRTMPTGKKSMREEVHDAQVRLQKSGSYKKHNDQQDRSGMPLRRWTWSPGNGVGLSSRVGMRRTLLCMKTSRTARNMSTDNSAHCLKR